MENLIAAKSAIQAEIILLENRLRKCREVESTIDSLIENQDIATPPTVVDSTSNSNKSTVANIDISQYPDYPFNQRMVERLKYLDNKFPKAWNIKVRLEQIVQIEGEEVRSRLKINMSQDMNYLVRTGIYLAFRYNNDRRCQFYVRPEWVNDEDGVKSIKPEFAPDPKDLENIPEYKLKSITWITREV